MKIKWVALALICLILSTGVASTHRLTFESAEHIFIGDTIKLQGLKSAQTDHHYYFKLSNDITLSYGEILSMPDYYGDPNHQISSEANFLAQKAQFAKQFASFSSCDPKYFHAFWPIVQDEINQIKAALKAHQDVSKVYEKLVDKENIALTKATHFRYMQLAASDYDHFGHDALTAYLAGHSVAIDTAIAGYAIKAGQDKVIDAACEKSLHYVTCLQDQAKRKLRLAYAQNAYASHFLTDRYAGGHIRTPFRALRETRPISLLGGLSGGIMHNEDCRQGVVVTNASGKYWVAYGDNYYFSKGNIENKAMIKVVVQKSADAIYTAYQYGYNPDPYSKKLQKMLPEPILPGQKVKITGLGQVIQSAPLYRLIHGVVYQRLDVNNHFDNQWTPIWSTLLTLLLYHAQKKQVVSMAWRMWLAHNHISLPRGI